MINLLANGVPQWISDWFPIIQIVLVSLIGLAGIVMIIAILTQPASAGPNSNAVLGGSNESYYSSHRGANNEGKLRRLTIICACIVAICAVLYFVTYNFYQGAL